MGGPNSNTKVELKKGPWTREEDQILLAYIEEHGHGSWRSLPAKAGLQRCGKSCRLRWTNYLRPDIRRGKLSTQEEKTIIRLHALLGNRWSAIAAHLPKRTDNEIKNYWNTRLKKRLTRMGIDPATHKPKNNPAGSARAATLSHMAQWETARLEAEARLARESKLLSNLHRLTATTPPPPPPPPLPPLAAPPCLDVLKACQAFTFPNGFFSSLNSPTSTLNFSTVPTIMGNDVVPTNVHVDSNYTGMKGEMGNLMQMDDDSLVYPTGYDCDMTCAMDLASFNDESDGYNMVCPIVGDFEDCRNNWNYLLDLVSSPMESPAL